MIDLDEAAQVGREATKGPWEASGQRFRPEPCCFSIRDPDGLAILDTFNSENQEIHRVDEGEEWDEIGRRNTEFIAYARNHWQEMVDEIRRLRAYVALDELKKKVVE